MQEMIYLNAQEPAEVESLERMKQEFLTYWADWAAVKPATMRAYNNGLKDFFSFLTENGIRRPDRQTIAAYIAQMKDRGLKPATVNSRLSAVKRFFQFCNNNGFCRNITEGVKGQKLDKGFKKDALSVSQAKELLQDNANIKRDYAILALMMTTGLRCVSVQAANVGDIRQQAGFPVLYYQGKGKEGKNDYVKLSEPVAAALAEYLSDRAGAGADSPLFTSRSNHGAGGRLTVRSISRVVKQAMKAAGLNSDRLTAHSLRHTAATINLLQGGTLEETRQLLGHSSINTTLIYAHNLDRLKNNSENRIATAIF